MALPAAALYAIYGVYALPWIVAARARRARGSCGRRCARRSSASACFLVAIAVAIPDSIDYYHHGHDVITSGEELGPLAGPLKPIQVAGIWLNGDYRFSPRALVDHLRCCRDRVLALALARRVVPRCAGAAPARCCSLSRRWSPGSLTAPAVVALHRREAARDPVAGASSLPPALGLARAAARGLAIAVAVVLGRRAARLRRARLPDRARRARSTGSTSSRRSTSASPARGRSSSTSTRSTRSTTCAASRGSDPYEGWSAGRAQLRNPQAAGRRRTRTTSTS